MKKNDVIMGMLRYSSYDIVLQEIPNEVSLSFTITGCGLRCIGCHSEYLWDKNNGEVLTDELFVSLIKKYEGMISCVLFMGGEWHLEELLNKIKFVNEIGLKTALYTGLNDRQIERKTPQLLTELNYLKTGRWSERLGGLNQPTTNQKLRNLKTGEILNHLFK